VKVGDEEKYCPVGSTKAPAGVHQRPVGVKMSNCTAVQRVQENGAIEDGGSWVSVKKDPDMYNCEKW
jgi:hypothetical protein